MVHLLPVELKCWCGLKEFDVTRQTKFRMNEKGEMVPVFGPWTNEIRCSAGHEVGDNTPLFAAICDVTNREVKP